jgi:transposase
VAETGRTAKAEREAGPVAFSVYEAVVAEYELVAAENERQAAEIAELKALIVELRERLERDSSNSNKPPSSDGPGGRKRRQKKAKRAKSKRRRGGQPGHEGSSRSLHGPEAIDRIVPLYPPACSRCGRTWKSPSGVCGRRHQLLELTTEGRYVTEFRRYEVECDLCGGRTLAPYDASIIPASPFGPRLVAVVALLTGTYHLSRRSARRLLAELFEIDISLGALSGMEARASEALAPAFDEAKEIVESAAVKHSDATSWLRAGALRSLWTVASNLATVFHILTDGQMATIVPIFGRRLGILVSDRASVFAFWVMRLRQICWAHLLRKFVSFSQRDGPAGAIGRELLGYTALVFDYWRGFCRGDLTRDELYIWMRPVMRRFEEALARASNAGIRHLSGSCENMLAHAAALWTFVTVEGVEPTNNHAERELRGFVLWRKRSFGCQSDRGERFAERAMTVAHTARKLGRGVLDYMLAAIEAHEAGRAAPKLFEQPARA